MRLYKSFSEHSTALRALLSLEYNCNATDFTKPENILTHSVLHEGRRVYGTEPYFFHMATTGGNAVITANNVLHPFLRTWMQGKVGYRLFEIPNLLPLERELNQYHYTLTATYHMFLPDKNVEPKRDFPVKWFHGKEIHQFYGDKRFPNAICDKYHPERPDTVVVCAYDGNQILGMAGCSEDAPHWMQIGIDVIPEFRSKGIGAYLVTLLKNQILQNGEIPFYGTDVSNYHSWNIAIQCGFRPTWVELGAEKQDPSSEFPL